MNNRIINNPFSKAGKEGAKQVPEIMPYECPSTVTHLVSYEGSDSVSERYYKAYALPYSLFKLLSYNCLTT